MKVTVTEKNCNYIFVVAYPKIFLVEDPIFNFNKRTFKFVKFASWDDNNFNTLNVHNYKFVCSIKIWFDVLNETSCISENMPENCTDEYS